MIENITNKLTENTFMIYAIKHYTNPQCLTNDEFNDDIKILTYIRRLLRKYNKNKQIKERLLLNHVITLNNLFGTPASARLLFFYCDDVHYSQLKTILESLYILPEYIPEVNLKEIEHDENLKSILEKL